MGTNDDILVSMPFHPHPLRVNSFQFVQFVATIRNQALREGTKERAWAMTWPRVSPSKANEIAPRIIIKP